MSGLLCLNRIVQRVAGEKDTDPVEDEEENQPEDRADDDTPNDTHSVICVRSDVLGRLAVIGAGVRGIGSGVIRKVSRRNRGWCGHRDETRNRASYNRLSARCGAEQRIVTDP